jgi:putative Mn2+ efflux pump MntP
MEMDYSSTGLWALMAATFILAATHTVSPDHWFPFVMVGRANRWKVSWVLGLAILAGIGHVGTSVAIGLIGVFAEKGASKEIATFLENATPLLLMIFGFGYAAYAFYKQRVGAHGHSHGIPIVNNWLGIDPHAFQLPSHDHHHEHTDEAVVSLKFGTVDLFLHNMELHMTIAHTDHHHHEATAGSEVHDHKHGHGPVQHNHTHFHPEGDIHRHPAEEHVHVHDDHEHGREHHDHDHHDHGHAHPEHLSPEHHHQQGRAESDLKDKRAGWGLVAILGLTPCIALLPLTFAAVKYGTMAIIMVNVCFAVATIGTITLFTWLGLMGLSWIKLEFFDEYGDIIAGVIIGLLGCATKLFEL